MNYSSPYDASSYDDAFEASLRRLDEQQRREQQAVSAELVRPPLPVCVMLWFAQKVVNDPVCLIAFPRSKNRGASTARSSR